MSRLARYPIRVTHSTMKRLKSLSIYHNESYDKILSRILDAKIGDELIVYLLDDLKSMTKLKCVVDYSKEEKNIQFYEHEEHKSANPPLLYSSGMVSAEEYSDFLQRLRGIEDLISVLAMLGHREYTIMNNMRIIRLN